MCPRSSLTCLHLQWTAGHVLVNVTGASTYPLPKCNAFLENIKFCYSHRKFEILTQSASRQITEFNSPSFTRRGLFRGTTLPAFRYSSLPQNATHTTAYCVHHVTRFSLSRDSDRAVRLIDSHRSIASNDFIWRKGLQNKKTTTISHNHRCGFAWN